MALSLLDGTTAAIDFTIEPTPGGTKASLKCIANFISYIIRRGTSQRFTFCSSGWAQPIAGVRAGFVHIDGFMGKGVALASPVALISQDSPLEFIFTADTGCTITQSAIETQEGDAVRALGESSRGLDLETSGPPTTAWVIA